MRNGAAKLLSALLQRLVLPGKKGHCVPMLRDIIGSQQKHGPTPHGELMGGKAPYRGIGEAKHLLPTQNFPCAAAAQRAALQQPLKQPSVLYRLPRHLPCQRLHAAGAQQERPRPPKEQQTGM